jgi:hypothetical protein
LTQRNVFQSGLTVCWSELFSDFTDFTLPPCSAGFNIS